MSSMIRTLARPAILGVLALLPAIHLSAQQHDHGASPYADIQDRAIKALSPEDIAGLEAGDGIGFALSAELNGVPGPRHVLDLADSLALEADQSAAVDDIYQRMRQEAVRLGADLLELERELDQRFAHRHVSEDDIRRLTAEIGRVRGALRATHLVAHVETLAVLRPEQVEAYLRLRGYAHGP
jgi:hypothetical protein